MPAYERMEGIDRDIVVMGGSSQEERQNVS